MVAVASGIIVPWPGTNASIPAGWSRETALDGYYIQAPGAGADADIVTVRGNASHSHTSPAHTPTQNSHTHTVSAGAGVGTVDGQQGPPNQTVASPTHTHASSTSASATGTNNSVAITVDLTTNDLSYIEVIFIKSDGTPLGIPDTAYAFFGSDTLPTSWSRVQGDRYLKGAVAGGNGGGTGGSTSHAHTSPAHTHTQNAHSHAAANSSNNTGTVVANSTADEVLVAQNTHLHSVSLNSGTPTNQSVTTTINSTAAEPVFKKLNLILNGVGATDFPDQIIALWGGTNASIPANWARVTDMDGNFPKNAAANGESLVTTGGALTHTHTASNCQPTQNAHNHGSTVGDGGTTLVTDVISTIRTCSLDTHTHTWTIGSTIATNNAVAVTIDVSASEAHYPQYKQLIFVQFTEPPPADFQANLALLNVGF